MGLRLLALVAVLASAAPARPSAGADLPSRLLASPPASLEDLAASVRNAGRLPVSRAGRIDVEGVKRRLGLVAALSGAAGPQLGSQDPKTRLGASLLVAMANAQLADALVSAEAPEAAAGEAAGPWRDQLEQTLSRLRWTAAAHLRACAGLAGPLGEPDFAQACGARLTSLNGIPALPEAKGEDSVKALAEARAPELRVCAEEDPRLSAGETLLATARLTLDGHGAVSEAAISGGEGSAGLFECLRGRLRLWVFPGLADAEIELPIRLSAAQR